MAPCLVIHFDERDSRARGLATAASSAREVRAEGFHQPDGDEPANHGAEFGDQ